MCENSYSVRISIAVGICLAVAVAPAQLLPPGCDLSAHLRQALTAHPTAELYDAAAAELARKHDSNCVAAALQKAIALNPAYAPAHLNLARLAAQRERFNEAEREAREAVRLDPSNMDAASTLGMIEVRLKHGDEAVELFRRVVARAPESADAHLNLGIALADGLDLEGALREFGEAVRLAPGSAATHLNRGRVLYDLRRYEEARPELEVAVRLSPGTPQPLYRLALVEKQLDHPERSLDLLRQVVSRQPGNADAHYLMGQNLARLGRTAEAVAAWKRTLEIDATRGEALYNLFRALRPIDPAQAKIYQDRFTALQESRQIADRAATLNNFALTAAAAGDVPHAIEQLKEAVTVCAGCRMLAELHKNLGLIYARSGDIDDAERELRAAQTDLAQDADIRRALELIAKIRSGR